MSDLNLETVRIEPAVEVRDRLGAGLYVFSTAAALVRAYGVNETAVGVDFRRCLVVAVHLGPCPTGGYSVRVIRAARRGEKVLITVRVTRPGPADPVTMAWTYPFHAVTLSRGALAQVGTLEFEGRTESGRSLGPVHMLG